ncbi:MAG TPA: ComEA family DNA-binding protein [Candidatus Hydrogenedentes bacterium]|nr:ComEA family DNA-binding protein [Candidatus Hydrogenedentota bacterium]
MQDKRWLAGIGACAAIVILGGVAFSVSAFMRRPPLLVTSPGPPPLIFESRPQETQPENAPDVEPVSVMTQDAEEAPLLLDAGGAMPPPTLAVSIMGAIQAPGFYKMPEDSRVHDLIEKAQGITPDADLDDINLAARLIDGTTLTIPARPIQGAQGEKLVIKGAPGASVVNPPFYTRSGWISGLAAGQSTPPAIVAPASGENSAKAGSGLINLNTASQQELETLPGIGLALAGRIIAFRAQRSFQSVDELREVPGIGEKRLEAVRALVTAP